MFNNKKAFSSFSVDNMDKAKEFYGKTLGLKIKEEKEMGFLSLPVGDGAHVMIYPKDNHEPATFTVFNLLVDDVEKAVDELNEKGVKFEHYKGFNQDKKGISRDWGMEIAWFKDPANNIIAVMKDK